MATANTAAHWLMQLIPGCQVVVIHIMQFEPEEARTLWRQAKEWLVRKIDKWPPKGAQPPMTWIGPEGDSTSSTLYGLDLQSGELALKQPYAEMLQASATFCHALARHFIMKRKAEAEMRQTHPTPKKNMQPKSKSEPRPPATPPPATVPPATVPPAAEPQTSLFRKCCQWRIAESETPFAVFFIGLEKDKQKTWISVFGLEDLPPALNQPAIGPAT